NFKVLSLCFHSAFSGSAHVTLDGRPLHSLRVADLKAALEERGLPKSGQKNALIKRLKGVIHVFYIYTFSLSFTLIYTNMKY
uniref:SAP domain-containing protein n=1 Tax=Cyprinus carpio TaxID=7962 RepID=A0A8C1R4T8_CYPCA